MIVDIHEIGGEVIVDTIGGVRDEHLYPARHGAHGNKIGILHAQQRERSALGTQAAHRIDGGLRILKVIVEAAHQPLARVAGDGYREGVIFVAHTS